MLINGMNLPDVFLIGAQKAATSSLAFYLESTAELRISNIKEPNFFVSGALPYIDGSFRGYCKINLLGEYEKLYKNFQLTDKICDASTDYLYKYKEFYDSVFSLYQENIKNIKIFCVVRCPAERAFSSWKMFRRDGKEPLNFKEAVMESSSRIKKYNYNYDYVGYGQYYDAVKYLKEKGLNVYVINMDNLINDKDNTLTRVSNFLGLEYVNIQSVTETQVNKSGNIKYPRIRNLLTSDTVFKKIFKAIVKKEHRMVIKNKLLNATISNQDITEEDKAWYYNFVKGSEFEVEKTIKLNEYE